MPSQEFRANGNPLENVVELVVDQGTRVLDLLINGAVIKGANVQIEEQWSEPDTYRDRVGNWVLSVGPVSRNITISFPIEQWTVLQAPQGENVRPV